MKRFLPVLVVLGLVACDNTAGVKVNADSAAKDIKNSPALDSLGNRAEQFGDSVGAKSERLADSAKAKGSRLVNKVGDKLNDFKNDLKDSTR